LNLTAEAPWDAALDAGCVGFTSCEPATETATFVLEVVLRSGPPPSGTRALPRFTPDADGVLHDRSEAWDATLAVTEPARARAELALRLRRTEPHVRRELALAALRCTLATVAPLLPGGGGLLVHGAALATEGGALVFVGASGQGKTTMTRRLAGWRVLADDAALVNVTDDGALVAGTPLRGKEGLPRDGHPAPLRGIVVLDKGAAELALTALSPAEATAALVPRVFWYAAAPELEARVLDTIASLVLRVPCWRLSSSLAHDVAPALLEVLEPSPRTRQGGSRGARRRRGGSESPRTRQGGSRGARRRRGGSESPRTRQGGSRGARRRRGGSESPRTRQGGSRGARRRRGGSN